LHDPNQPSLPDNAGRYGRAQIAKHLTTTNFLDNANRDGINPSKYRFRDDLRPGLYLKR
jgi:hypothetical protein